MTGTAAILGCGTIGSGWAARFLLNGWDVRVFDPDPAARARFEAALDEARRTLPMLYDIALPAEGRLSHAPTLSAAVAGAHWVQESAPERLALKRKLFQQVQSACAPGAVIASSSAGFTPAELQGCASRPGRILVACPVAPVHLLPLVELRSSPANDPGLADQAAATLAALGLHPLQPRGGGGLGSRLLGALLREARALVEEGAATAPEIDTALRCGLGLRLALAGLSGPDDRPPEASRRRGEGDLVAILRALKSRDAGAGAALGAHEARLRRPLAPGPVMTTVERMVPLDWTDYNGHMNEGRYGQVFSDAADAVLLAIGSDAAYVAAGHSWFTAETGVRFLAETRAGERIRVTTRVTQAEGRKLRLAHEMTGPDGTLRATCDQFLLHVSLATRRSCPPVPPVAERLLLLRGA